MRQIKSRSVVEGVAHHKDLGVREYATCSVQKIRIEKSRHMLRMALVELGPGKKTIVELGCGCLDISGPLSTNHEVIGIDCNAASLQRARELHPQAVTGFSAIEDVDAFQADVIVLCEILEHLHDPSALVRKWLPKCKAAVISHPLDEALDSPLSAGDHCWSFSEDDLRNWYTIAGYNLREGEKFQMGSYKIGLTRGVNT